MKNTCVEKAKKIRLFVLDVDGVLTDGIIHYLNQDLIMRSFHVHDGLGIKLCQFAGIPIAIISAKESPDVFQRLVDLNIQHIYLGCEKKTIAYQDLKEKLQLTDNEIAYMGDDLLDLPVLEQVGFSCTVLQAPDFIREKVDYISKRPGGQGAVRDVCEFILKAKNCFDDVLKSYLAQSV